MRGLYTLVKIESANISLWEQEGFVSFLAISPVHINFLHTLKKHWIWYDSISGNSLWVALTFDSSEGEMTKDDERRASDLVDFLGLDLSCLPCLIFAKGPKSKEFFVYSLDANASIAEVDQTLRDVIAACKKHMPTEKSGRTDHGFDALTQELRSMQPNKIVNWISNVTGETLRKSIIRIVTSGIG